MVANNHKKAGHLFDVSTHLRFIIKLIQNFLKQHYRTYNKKYFVIGPCGCIFIVFEVELRTF